MKNLCQQTEKILKEQLSLETESLNDKSEKVFLGVIRVHRASINMTIMKLLIREIVF